MLNHEIYMPRKIPGIRHSGLAILLAVDYTNERTINSEGGPEDSDSVLKEVESYLKERPIDRESLH